MPTSTFAYLFRGGLVLWLLCLLAPMAHATHIVGGELDLQYLSGNNYQLNLNLYFDAVNGQPGALDNSLTASIFERGSNQRMMDVVLPLTNNTFVSYTNPACTTPSLVTRRLVYSRVITLTSQMYANPGGYYVAVERCCRNNGISNIVNPGGAAQTFYLEFPAVVRNAQPFRNSTPRIFPPLSDYACRGELFYYNFGGADADGDSLVYDLVTPLNGHADTFEPKPAQALSAPYSTVQWTDSLSATRQIPGRPTLSIGRFTGRLEVLPTRLGLFVFGVRCTEYRKGVRLGEVRRDFQLKVINCPTNSRPKVVMQLPDRPRTYQPGRDTLRMTPTSGRCFTLKFTDPDLTSALTLSMRPVNFTGPLPTLSLLQGRVRAPGAPDTLVSQLCFPSCFNTKGQVYLLDLIVADDGCSLPKRDTVRVAFTSLPDPNAPPQLRTTATLPLRARPGDLVTFEVVATDPENDPMTMEMAGRGFSPAGLGAQFSQLQTNSQLTGRFSWRVDCRAVDKPVYEFEFTSAAAPCSDRQATTLVIPIQIDYLNHAPELGGTLPPIVAGTSAPIVIKLPLGGVYEASLTGLDVDNDALALAAAGTGFELATAGMSFVPRNGNGQAAGTFRWQATCESVRPNGLEVTFSLQENTCRPQPQTRVVRFEVEPPVVREFIPSNIITPYQRDEKNDYFELDNVTNNLPPDFCDSRFADIEIFNRWGARVYHTTSRSFRWDGGGLPAGVYYYVIEFTNKKRYKGSVTIAN
ncbi:gliding motility-associated C-terminal domain-containing protein [Hymenobacter sediminis]|uniref:T9SS type B sorting domain-containing protein n=1 Tax=Hymenobacter sediminis TaxID=2218621 RepID=UPI000DA66FF3|nr:gliding motility-associated C-terminal domain-containing protein [Hymenobacter sediminis]RPD48725.1 gliding motility-associated C-terminal domain-containing protein [Hymenobacter sediminis]